MGFVASILTIVGGALGMAIQPPSPAMAISGSPTSYGWGAGYGTFRQEQPPRYPAAIPPDPVPSPTSPAPGGNTPAGENTTQRARFFSHAGAPVASWDLFCGACGSKLG